MIFQIQSSRYSAKDGYVAIVAVKLATEPCWRRLLREKDAPVWLSLDHSRIDLDGCQFQKERWRSSYFTSILES